VQYTVGMTATVSERKRQAIASAALALFARDGYERTSVDAIAAEAGVSKRTVYSHYGDKESLFMRVVQDTYELMRLRFTEAVDSNLRDVDDVEKSLVSCMRMVVREVNQSPERARLLSLLITELPRSPALADLWHGRGITALLATPIARLAAAGLLTADDPVEAAGHLSALTIGQINNRSMMGAVPLSEAETDRIITGGVRVFLCAYGPGR
jgi:TetR/AcrR family transcriptional regulator, mexJK operon transcriptional repressor